MAGSHGVRGSIPLSSIKKPEPLSRLRLFYAMISLMNSTITFYVYAINLN